MRPTKKVIRRSIAAARRAVSLAYRGDGAGGPNGVAKRAFDFADAYGKLGDPYKEVARQMLDQDYEFLTPAVLDVIEEAIGGYFSWVDSAITDAREQVEATAGPRGGPRRRRR